MAMKCMDDYAGLTIHYLLSSMQYRIRKPFWIRVDFPGTFHPIRSKRSMKSWHKFRISFHLFPNVSTQFTSICIKFNAIVQFRPVYECTNQLFAQWTNGPKSEREKNRCAKIDCLHIFGVYCARNVKWSKCSDCFFVCLSHSHWRFEYGLKYVLSHWNFNWFRTFTQRIR